jgi:hypothetical protein
MHKGATMSMRTYGGAILRSGFRQQGGVKPAVHHTVAMEIDATHSLGSKTRLQGAQRGTVQPVRGKS